MKSQGFPKEQRLCGDKAIQALFSKGSRSTLNPFNIIYHFQLSSEEYGQNVKILISVPKRKFKKANQRNRVRRRIREAWRISRNPLLEKISHLSSQPEKKALHIAFIYNTEKQLPWTSILNAMERAILSLSARISLL
jgi:ribonuclease P protein component